MDDIDEGARVERHSFFRYAGLHNRQNQTSNLVQKKNNNNIIATINYFNLKN